MKRIVLCMLSLLVMLTMTAPPVIWAAPPAGELQVYVDGLPVAFDIPPVIENNRTLVPFRALAEALNVQVDWDGTTQTVTAGKDNTTVRLQIGNKTAYHGEAPIALEVPPAAREGRILIPLRFFSEVFDCQVVWDPAANRVQLISPPKAMEITGFYALGDSATSSWRDLFGKAYPEAERGNTDALSRVALGWYSLDEQGKLLTKSRTGWRRPEGWEAVLAKIKEYGLKSEMVVHLTDEGAAIMKLLNDETAIKQAVDGIAAEAVAYQGVNLDFEGLGYGDEGEQLTAVRQDFTQFVRLLSERLKTAGVPLTLTLHAPNSAYRGYDYQALGQLADRIIVMAHDYGPKPEPVNAVIEAVEQAKAAVPAEKLVLAISVPSETAESIKTKIGIAKRYNLRGISLWRLGLISDEMWNALRSAVVPIK